MTDFAEFVILALFSVGSAMVLASMLGGSSDDLVPPDPPKASKGEPAAERTKEVLQMLMEASVLSKKHGIPELTMVLDGAVNEIARQHMVIEEKSRELKAIKKGVVWS
jgi:hypothetical protein